MKELRLRGISTPEAGNAYLPEFGADYNKRFGREPQSPHDAHRPVREDEDLERIFTWQEERKLSKNLTLHYKRVTYLVEPGPETLPLGGNRCRVHEYEDGRIEVRHEGQLLPCRVFGDPAPRVQQADIVANKRLGTVLAEIQKDQRERDRHPISPIRSSRSGRRTGSGPLGNKRTLPPLYNPGGKPYPTFLCVDKNRARIPYPRMGIGPLERSVRRPRRWLPAEVSNDPESRAIVCSPVCVGPKAPASPA